MARLLFLAWWLLVGAWPALAGDVLDRVKQQGVLRCGVGENLPGLAVKDAEGRWSGLDVDYCRAVAAAVLGDPAKVKFRGLSSQGRFPSLLAREVDVLTRNTTWTLGREARFGVSFVGPLLLTGPGLLVRAEAGIDKASQLDNTRLCLVKGSTHEQSLRTWAANLGLHFTAVSFDSPAAARAGLLAGQCESMVGDVTVLAGVRAAAPDGRDRLKLLFKETTVEPISPVVLRGDEAWLTVLRAVLSMLIGAEEVGLTGAAVRDGDLSANPAGRYYLEQADTLASPLGLPPGWAGRALAAVGNYGELFERHLGRGSPLDLPRVRNRPVSQGGLLYPLPF